MPQMFDDLTAFDWLILAYVAAYSDEEAVPVPLVQATLGNQLQHADSVVDSITRLCTRGHLHSDHDLLVVLPSSRRRVVEQLTTTQSWPELFDAIEGAIVEQLLDAESPHDASIEALLPQAQAITNRALGRATPLAPLLASLLGQVMAQQGALESESYLRSGVAGDLAALPIDELLIHARSLVLLAELALARGEHEVARELAARALHISSQQLVEERAEGFGAPVPIANSSADADTQKKGVSMRKRIIGQGAAAEALSTQPWLEVERLAQVEVSSEAAGHPIEAALIPGIGAGWRAGEPGTQTIRLLFDAPQTLRRLRLVFDEAQQARTQEFVLRWSGDSSRPYQEIVRQQYHFSPSGATQEVEDYVLALDGVSVLELQLTPDIEGGEATASLTALQLA